MSCRTGKKLNLLDDKLYRYLEKNVSIMPMRFVKLIANFYTDARIRKLYLKRLGAVLGEGTYPNLGFRIVSSDYSDRLFIGKNCSIAVNAVFVCVSEHNNAQEMLQYPYIAEIAQKKSRIIVGDEVWIGANVTVMPGIEIGKGAVIGAGSVVTHNIPEYAVVVGNPARVIKDSRSGRKLPCAEKEVCND